MWAAVLAPGRLNPRVIAPERAEPGDEVLIEVDTGAPESSVYLVVKDARLLAPDTPSARLAGQMKSFVEASSKRLSVGHATDSIATSVFRASRYQPVPPITASTTRKLNTATSLCCLISETKYAALELVC